MKRDRRNRLVRRGEVDSRKEVGQTVERAGGVYSQAAFSPDGRSLAYTLYYEAFWSWKRYRGGMTVPIWILDLDSYTHIEIPHENASDTFPCWVGGAIYFLSDRTGSMNVFQYDLETQSLAQRTFHEDFDVRSLTGGAGRLAYEQGGRLHLFDLDSGKARALSIEIAASCARSRTMSVASSIRSFSRSFTRSSDHSRST